MITIKIQPNRKSKIWLKNNNFVIRAIEEALSLCHNCEDKRVDYSINTTYILKLEVIEDTNMGFYTWDTNLLEIGVMGNTEEEVMYNFTHNLLHESKHWYQSAVLGIPLSKINYTEEDLYKKTRKYTNNRYEKQATTFEEKYAKPFVDIYKALANLHS